MSAPLLAFDVNETLLDLAPLDETFDRLFGDAALRPVWFQLMLQLAFVGGLTNRYVDFSQAQRAAATLLVHRTGRGDAEAAGDELADAMERLPPHADVVGALTRLQEAGFRLVTLTNSPLEVARSQLAFAAIAGFFVDMLSADEVRALKPRPEPYRLVGERMHVDLDRVYLVAAHGWDAAGALAAGAHACFVARHGGRPSPVPPQPDLVASDLNDAADQLIATLA